MKTILNEDLLNRFLMDEETGGDSGNSGGSGSNSGSGNGGNENNGNGSDGDKGKQPGTIPPDPFWGIGGLSIEDEGEKE